MDRVRRFPGREHARAPSSRTPNLLHRRTFVALQAAERAVKTNVSAMKESHVLEVPEQFLEDLHEFG